MLFSAFLVPVNAFSLISLVRAQHVLCSNCIVNNLSDQDCPSIEGGPPASDCAYLGLVTFGGAENAGVENAGGITYGKPSEQKTLTIPGV